MHQIGCNNLDYKEMNKDKVADLFNKIMSRILWIYRIKGVISKIVKIIKDLMIIIEEVNQLSK